MDDIPCLGCGTFFRPRNRLQSYCSNPICQATRKALWQKDKMKNDLDYRANQKLSQKKWLKKNPSYWKDYRNKNPLRVERNRLLQKIRNRGLSKDSDLAEVRIIAKMDARKPFNLGVKQGFWLIPAVAKMDAAKFYFHLIPDR